jgi:Tol biopolymer transport system component
MGEVYRGRDTRLNRSVAIKILPAHLSANDEAKQRFEREAKTISSLNHPNICVLHDIGSQDGTSYLVMELVEGETLESRLQKGPMPLVQALDCAVQICDALEKAHRAGIVHRDLKPGNIMLTPSGAKLLDFGLAKPAVALVSSQASSQDVHLTPTINVTSLGAAPAAALTQQGTIVGTFQYLAPEVAQGREADGRSDIFSLGCVLYEMVTGRKAFEGKSQLSVLTAILEKDVDPVSAVVPTSPASLDYVVQACLEKDPEKRIQTAHDLKLQLGWVMKSRSQTGAAAIQKKNNRALVWVAAAAVVVGLAVIAAIVFAFGGHAPKRVLRTTLLPPEGLLFETLYHNGPPVISPDGTRVVFVAGKDGKNSLWVRSLDKLEAMPLRGTEEAFYPFWSPDGRMVAFFTPGKLWKMDLNGGSPSLICEAAEARGGSWGTSNTIVFAPTPASGLSRVSADGGTPQELPSSLRINGFVSERWPELLPDGKHYLFLHSPNGDAEAGNEIRYSSTDKHEDRVLMTGRFYSMRYVNGWLLAVRDGSLFAWKFDAGSGKITGEGTQIVNRVAVDDVTASAVFSVSERGDLLYQLASGGTGDRHVWLDATGKQLAQISEPGIYGATRISPNGTHLVTPVVEASGADHFWVWDINGGARARVTTKSANPDMAVWSADGKTLYYSAFDEKGHRSTLLVPADGSRPEQVLINTAADVMPVDTTSDGKWLLYQEVIDEAHPLTSTGTAKLKAYPLAAGLEGFTVLENVTAGSNARLRSGTQDWLAYQANTSGRPEIYLTRFPHPGSKFQVSSNGGTQAVWSPDGKTLFFLDRTEKMMAVSVNVTGDSVEIGTPRTLFPTGVRSSTPSGAYDVAKDGRFLVINSVTENTAPVALVTNWDAEVK